MLDPVHEQATPHLVVDADVLDGQPRCDGVVRRGPRAGAAAARQDAQDPGHRPAAAGGRSGRADPGHGRRGRGLRVAGFDDLFIAYPLWTDAAKGERLQALASRVSLTIGVDSVGGAGRSAAHLSDLGARRGRLRPAPQRRRARAVAGTLAGAAAQRRARRRRGVHVPRSLLLPRCLADVAAQESAALGTRREPWPRRDRASVVSGGSTPSVAARRRLRAHRAAPRRLRLRRRPAVGARHTSSRPVALTALATVVSHAGGQSCSTPAARRSAPTGPRGPPGSAGCSTTPTPGSPALRAPRRRLLAGRRPRPPLGERVRVVPNHVCNAVNLADELSWCATARVGDLGGGGPRREHLTPPALVVFDCDGVLVDSERLTVGVEARVLTELGWPMTAEEVVERWMGRSSRCSSPTSSGASAPTGPGTSTCGPPPSCTDVRPGAHRDRRSGDLARPPRRAGRRRAASPPAAPTGGFAGPWASRVCWSGSATGSSAPTDVRHGKPAPDLFLHAAAAMGTIRPRARSSRTVCTACRPASRRA